MDQETKDKLIENSAHYWYIIVIIIAVAIIGFMSDRIQKRDAEITEMKLKYNLTEELASIESRLAAMKVREAEYLKVQANQDKLREVLAELSDRQKELANIKKGNIKDDVTKMDSNSLSNMFNAMGYPNTIIQ